MSSKIFEPKTREKIETAVTDLLNKQADFLSVITAKSPRAVGDALQEIVAENFEAIIADFSKEYSTDFARRAMADLAFTDKEDFYYVIDVKTHRLETSFNMPNLTSVERLARFYENDKNYFVLLFITYSASETKIRVTKTRFIPIELLSWNCLTIGALGWGQIQIANANKIQIDEAHTRKQWMIELCDTLFEFYPKEIEKITGRIEYFQKVKARWDAKI